MDINRAITRERGLDTTGVRMPDMRSVTDSIPLSGELSPSAQRDTLMTWLLEEGRFLGRTRDLVDQFCQRLVALGVPLHRVLASVRTIHPQILASAYMWQRGQESMVINRGHDILNDPEYLDSPFKQIHDGAGGIRRRIEDPETPIDFPILRDLKEKGTTDYLVAPVVFSDGTINAVSFTTDVTGGFETRHLALIYDVLPVLTTVIETLATRRMAASLLDTYIGHHAGERVLSGQIVRGSGETIHAVIVYSDLRGFTRMSASKPRDEVIALLNDYFERVITAIQDHGGQVLKLIGDGVLAIFPLADPAFSPYVCRSAIDAAQDAARAIAAYNSERDSAGEEPIRFGFALHLGDVMYGNIGAPDRLDFTAIGPAVNTAHRIEEMTGPLNHPIVMSAPVAKASGRTLPSLGAHILRGMTEPMELFTIPAIGPADR